jgi:hypothetical protein
MSTGEALYLLMVVVAFTGFALVLAYYSRQQSRLDRERAARTPAQAPAEATPGRGHAHA